MGDTKVLILHAVRREGGAIRRLATWTDLLAEIEADAKVVSVLPENRSRAAIDPSGLFEALTGRAALESVIWNRSELMKRLAEEVYETVVVITRRALSPRVVRHLVDSGTKRIVLDIVDPLSKSYEQRSRIFGGVAGTGYRFLAFAASRSEKVSAGFESTVVAAGWEDAKELNVSWLPILLRDRDSTSPELDPRGEVQGRSLQSHAVFVGTLDYAPNIDAVERLCRSIWPKVTESVPGAVLSIAGRRPSQRVVNASRGVRGVQLLGQFEDPIAPYRSALVSISPLSVSTGFQIKVLDAAEIGVAQVVTPAAIRGFAPGFPARVASEDGELAGAVVDLLRNPGQARELGVAARRHVHDRYSTSAWKDDVSRLIC